MVVHANKKGRLGHKCQTLFCLALQGYVLVALEVKPTVDCLLFVLWPKPRTLTHTTHVERSVQRCVWPPDWPTRPSDRKLSINVVMFTLSIRSYHIDLTTLIVSLDSIVLVTKFCWVKSSLYLSYDNWKTNFQVDTYKSMLSKSRFLWLKHG